MASLAIALLTGLLVTEAFRKVEFSNFSRKFLKKLLVPVVLFLSLLSLISLSYFIPENLILWMKHP